MFYRILLCVLCCGSLYAQHTAVVEVLGKIINKHTQLELKLARQKAIIEEQINKCKADMSNVSTSEQAKELEVENTKNKLDDFENEFAEIESEIVALTEDSSNQQADTATTARGTKEKSKNTLTDREKTVSLSKMEEYSRQLKDVIEDNKIYKEGIEALVLKDEEHDGLLAEQKESYRELESKFLDFQEQDSTNQKELAKLKDDFNSLKKEFEKTKVNPKKSSTNKSSAKKENKTEAEGDIEDDEDSD